MKGESLAHAVWRTNQFAYQVATNAAWQAWNLAKTSNASQKTQDAFKAAYEAARIQQEVNQLPGNIPDFYTPAPKAPTKPKETPTTDYKAAAAAAKDEAKPKTDQAEEIRRARQEYEDSLIKDPIARAKAEIAGNQATDRIRQEQGNGRGGRVLEPTEAVARKEMGLADLIRDKSAAITS